MHVFILRWCPSFSDVNETIVGQHEQLEREIRLNPIELHHVRQGYAIPFSSEFKLIEYRVKKEAVPAFLSKLNIGNLVPKTNQPTFFDCFAPYWCINMRDTIRAMRLALKEKVSFKKLCSFFNSKSEIHKYYLNKVKRQDFGYSWNQVASAGRKLIRMQYLLCKLSSLGLWLHTVDQDTKKHEPYLKSGWCYNFCLGVLPDVHVDVTPDNKERKYYESL